ncbi:MAG: NUDIX hydrolase [Melioribacteraceae bacterium]|nr:NUDIX hydrolase [Melioribacteraceae bacterium]
MIPISYLFELVSQPTTRVRGELYVLNNKKELLVGKSFRSGNWTIPGGAVDRNESPKIAAMRETLEEVGVRVKNVTPLNKQPHVTNYISIYGSWDNVPTGVKMWGHDKLETYSFRADFDKNDKRLWRMSRDKRSAIWVDIAEYEIYIKARLRMLKPTQKHLEVRMGHSLNMLKLLRK